ncbi:hypothetical protein BDC45DRAFT_197713 [Circinella umbellata]|nr:hypothetical protein BDC45DRAFT_197713 [Circinella umbellata]
MPKIIIIIIIIMVLKQLSWMQSNLKSKDLLIFFLVVDFSFVILFFILFFPLNPLFSYSILPIKPPSLLYICIHVLVSQTWFYSIQFSSTFYRLAELDELEKTILDGTHEEYRERMAHAETKRLNEMKNAKLRRDLEEDDIRFTFEAFRKAAYDQFYQCKAELRKRMINQIQAQIKRSEEEWHTLSHENTGCSDDDQELYDWLPHRHTSIYFEPLGLKQEEILDDITAARSKIYITENK